MVQRRTSRPKRIGDLIQEQIRSLGWEQRLREEEVYSQWETIVGPQIAAHSRPSHIANRRLTVVTESPIWTQQLLFLKVDLLRRIQEQLGPGLVTELFFVTGRLREARPPARPDSTRSLPPLPEIPADLESEILAIPDAEVREAVRRLCQVGMRHQLLAPDLPGS